MILSGKLVAIAAAPLLLVALLLSASYLVVDVQQGGPDGHRFIVPVPLVLARAALAVAPQEARLLSCPELADYLPAARRLLGELRQIPDAELVRVEQRDRLVRIRKVGSQLEIEVRGPGEQADVVVPLEAAQRMLDSYRDGGFENADLVAALGSVSNTDLVHVRDGDNEVKVWIW